MINLFNIGFTKKTAKEFFGIIKANKIDCLVDVRLNPNGQLSRFAFEQDLPYLNWQMAVNINTVWTWHRLRNY